MFIFFVCCAISLHPSSFFLVYHRISWPSFVLGGRTWPKYKSRSSKVDFNGSKLRDRISALPRQRVLAENVRAAFPWGKRVEGRTSFFLEIFYNSLSWVAEVFTLPKKLELKISTDRRGRQLPYSYTENSFNYFYADHGLWLSWGREASADCSFCWTVCRNGLLF